MHIRQIDNQDFFTRISLFHLLHGKFYALCSHVFSLRIQIDQFRCDLRCFFYVLLQEKI